MARPKKYPWDEWLNGETWELRRGKDFQAGAETFRSTVWRAAELRSKRVKTRGFKDEGGEGLVIRAYEEGEEFHWDRAPGNAKYPWDEWLNGETWELRRGEDFQARGKYFRSMARKAAKQRGKRVQARLLSDDEGEGLLIRAYEKGEEFAWEEAGRSGPTAMYPWDEWLNGETWELRRGKDFRSKSFHSTVWIAAERNGKRVKTRSFKDDKGEGLLIRAYEEGEEFHWDRAPWNTKYPWDKWLNGETWELRRGEDFQASSKSLRSIAQAAAKRRGKQVKTRGLKDESGEGLLIRAYEEGEEFHWDRAPRSTKYPWDEWLNGETWELRRGRDFQVRVEAFRTAARQVAERRGKRVKTRGLNDDKGEGLVIRAYEDGS